ncbi:MAG: hypothetical protein ABR574_12195 [Cryomorphaceae bacterium]|nr:hypothetical protein [Flavobacteriales bacterium]
MEKDTLKSNPYPEVTNLDNLQALVEQLFAFQKERNFRDKDVSDVLSSSVYAYFLPRSTRSFPAKVVYFFLDKLNKHYGDTLRSVFSLDSSFQYPQAHALIIRGLIKLYPVNPTNILEHEIRGLGDELLEMRQKSFENFGWGQPFDWPSRQIMRAGTPRATVSSQVGMAFLDIYEAFKDEKYLKWAERICHMFIENFNYTPDADGDFCFSYTTEDNYHVHNASTLAAAFLIRTHYHTSNQKYLDYGQRALQFTAKHQNPDGSWFYRAKPDKVTGLIDNYHTGFVLESYLDSKAYWTGGDFPFELELKAGFEYYIRNFFTDKFEPKYRPDKIYPIDIQACAQSLLTVILYRRNAENNQEHKQILDGILNYTLINFYNGKGQFYYRMYPNRIDKNSFIRWGDSWMIRAIGEYMYSEFHEKNH